MEVPFHRPDITDEEIEAVARTLRSGWLTMGPETFRFEKELAGYLGADHAVCLSSGTAALHLALICAGIGPGDQVIMPAVTFVSTAEAVRYLGAEPVLADVEYDTHCLDVQDLRKRITKRTRAIIPVHFGGHPADMDPLLDLAREHELAVIEDAAHALPSKYKGRYCGTLGDAGCFSFYATKTLTTGEGGMIITGRQDWADRARSLRLHGISRDAWNRYGKGGSWRYDVHETGYKYNMTDMQAALGRGQLSRLDDMHGKRREIARAYTEAFEPLPGLVPFREREGCRSSWHLYPLKIDGEDEGVRDDMMDILSKKGISTSLHFIPLHHFSGYRDLDTGDLPVSEKVFRQNLSLPINSKMVEDDISFVKNEVIQAAREVLK